MDSRSLEAKICERIGFTRTMVTETEMEGVVLPLELLHGC